MASGTSSASSVPSPACAVAVCLVGSPRTFPRTHVVSSIRRNVIEQLRFHCAVDIFAVMAIKDAPPKANMRPAANWTWNWNFASVTPDAAELDAALRLVRPRVVDLYDSLHPMLNSSCTPIPGSFWAKNGNRVVAQLESWSRCMGHVAIAETARGATYDWVIKARPDGYWRAPHPSLVQGGGDVMLNKAPFQDQHVVLPRSVAPVVMQDMLD